jgi:hypothetical protein
VVFYSIIVFLFLKINDYRSGAVAGVIGFGIHIFELLSGRASWLEGMDILFLYLNIILPVPLIGFSILADRGNK